MRLLPLIVFAMAGSLIAGEPPPAYPLWDGSESVADYAKKVNLPPTKTLDLGNGVKMELVLIPAGKFVMGTPEPTPVDEEGFHGKIVTGQALLATSTVALLAMLLFVVIRAVRKKRRPQLSLGLLLLVTIAAGGCVLSGVHWRQSVRALEQAKVEYAASRARYTVADKEEKPAHTVTLTQPFYMAKFLVTQEQYQQVMGANPSTFKTSKDNPVDSVSWNDAQEFCKKLTTLAPNPSTTRGRLPTDAEWEFSCRAGTTTTYYSGDAEKDLGRVAWYDGNSKNTTHPVGQKAPNAFGLYDMHGNLWQWCQDWFEYDYYAKSPPENPENLAPSAAGRVLRGGNWGGGIKECRSTLRGGVIPDGRTECFGFRVVVPVAPRTP